MKDNAAVLKKGFNDGVQVIVQTLIASLHNAAVELIRYELAHKGYLGFTGNTQTSYMCGIYAYGKLDHIVTELSKPLGKKLRKGQFLFLKNPYEGIARGVRANIETDGGYGWETSLNFLKSYSVSEKKVGLVMTTGTEYSTYLEDVRNLDVLTSAFDEAKAILERNWKPIPE